MQLEVFPTRDGTWAWRRRTDGDKATRPDHTEYDTRGEAVQAARESREDDDQRFVLLRQDGSEYGALLWGDSPRRSTRSVDITAAGEEGGV